MGPPVTCRCPCARGCAHDRRQPARAAPWSAQRAVRHRLWRRRGHRRRRVVSSARRSTQHRVDAARRRCTRWPVRCSGARGDAERAARRRDRGIAQPLGALAVRRLPYCGGGVAPPLCRLDFSGCARLGVDPHRGSLDHGALWSRSGGPRLAIAPVCAPAGVRPLSHPTGCERGRAGGRIRPGAWLAGTGTGHDFAQRHDGRGAGGPDPVDSTPEPRGGYVMLPSWVGVVSAISLAIIALAALVTAGAITAAALGVRTAVRALKGFAGPAIADVRQLIGSIKIEADALVGASRDVRQRIVRAADAAEDRLTDLDTLAEVMQQELEETALDAAATMRDVRRGLSVWRWSRKLLKGKKRP